MVMTRACIWLLMVILAFLICGGLAGRLPTTIGMAL